MSKEKDWNDKAQQDPEQAKKDFEDIEAQELDVTNITQIEDHNPGLKILNDLNKKHVFIKNLGGKSAVSMYVYSEVTKRKELDFILLDTFKNMYMDMTINRITYGVFWLMDNRKNTVESITFDPSRESGIIEINGEKYLNLWNGLATTPAKGSWKRTCKHIYKILCNSDPAKFEYVIKWLAFLVQHPEERPEVALVFKGEKGAGKSFLFEQFKKIFGSHGAIIAEASRFIGKFNAHFKSLCFLFCDEAYFPGDKEAEGVLKARITGEFIDTEAKRYDAITLKNRLHIVMCTNKDLVIPATKDERRFFIEAINNMYAKNRIADKIRQKYFNELFYEMDHGGREAMLYDLLNVNLIGWHPRNDVPETQELLQQKAMNLNSLQTAMRTILEDGILPGEYRNEKYSISAESLFTYMEKIDLHCVKFSMHKKTDIIKRLGATKGRIPGVGRVKWTFPELKEMRKNWDSNFVENAWDDQTKWTVINSDY